MDEKINPRLVQQYSADYALRVAESFFATKEKISGAEIARLCDMQQINLFVLRELLKAWQQEIQKYKSPYFDYNATAVRGALRDFQNILSNHIAVAKDNFIPLLRKSVSQTIYLVLSPYDFYAHILNKHGASTVDSDYLRKETKYIRINKAPLDILADQLSQEVGGVATGQAAFSQLESILEEVSFTPEEIGPHIAALNKTLPLEVSSLYEVIEDSPALMPFQDNAIDTILSSKHAPSPPPITIAEGYQKIPQLKDRLMINQKFMFTKMLFNGDFDAFNKAIANVDSLTSMDEATRYLALHYPNWNKSSEEYIEFIELLNQRFA